MENSENPIKKNLEDLFKDFIPDQEAPQELKNEVFQTLDTLNLIGDIADLFTDKFTKTEVDFLDILSPQSECSENSFDPEEEE